MRRKKQARAGKAGERSSSGNSSPKQAPKVVVKRQRNPFANDDVDNEKRHRLLELIMKTNSIRRAAHQLGINNSTAKSIYYKFKKTG